MPTTTPEDSPDQRQIRPHGGPGCRALPAMARGTPETQVAGRCSSRRRTSSLDIVRHGRSSVRALLTASAGIAGLREDDDDHPQGNGRQRSLDRPPTTVTAVRSCAALSGGGSSRCPGAPDARCRVSRCRCKPGAAGQSHGRKPLRRTALLEARWLWRGYPRRTCPACARGAGECPPEESPRSGTRCRPCASCGSSCAARTGHHPSADRPHAHVCIDRLFRSALLMTGFRPVTYGDVAV